jgi:hypothetical protein
MQYSLVIYQDHTSTIAARRIVTREELIDWFDNWVAVKDGVQHRFYVEPHMIVTEEENPLERVQARIKGLHRPQIVRRGTVCAECRQSWPCATIDVISASES